MPGQGKGGRNRGRGRGRAAEWMVCRMCFSTAQVASPCPFYPSALWEKSQALQCTMVTRILAFAMTNAEGRFHRIGLSERPHGILENTRKRWPQITFQLWRLVLVAENSVFFVAYSRKIVISQLENQKSLFLKGTIHKYDPALSPQSDEQKAFLEGTERTNNTISLSRLCISNSLADDSV